MKIIKLAIAMLLLGSVPAFAYIDPGTGMMAIQGMVALAVWLVAFITHPIRTIKNLLERWRNRGDARS